MSETKNHFINNQKFKIEENALLQWSSSTTSSTKPKTTKSTAPATKWAAEWSKPSSRSPTTRSSNAS